MECLISCVAVCTPPLEKEEQGVDHSNAAEDDVPCCEVHHRGYYYFQVALPVVLSGCYKNTSCPVVVAKSRLIWRVSIRFRQRAGDRHGTHNTPSPLTTLGTALTYTMPYGFPTFHPLRTSFCMFLSWSVSRRHSTSDDVPMGGGTPQRKIEKRHSRRTPVLHPVQKRCEPSKTSIGVRRL